MIKQSAASFISIVGGMFLVILTAGIMVPFYSSPYLPWAQTGLLVLLILADIALFHWMKGAGGRKLAALQAE